MSSERTGKTSIPTMVRSISLYISGLPRGRAAAAACAGVRLRLDVGAEPLQVGDERDDLAVGGRVPCRRPSRPLGDLRRPAPACRRGPAARSPSGYGTPSRRSVMILPSMCVSSSLSVVHPRVARHDRAGRRRPRVLHVQEVPGVRVLAADAMQVRPGALRAPQERVVVDELAGLAVLAVALRLGAHRPDHLRVAADAAFADVEVAALEFERRVRLHRGDGRDVGADERRRARTRRRRR